MTDLKRMEAKLDLILKLLQPSETEPVQTENEKEAEASELFFRVFKRPEPKIRVPMILSATDIAAEIKLTTGKHVDAQTIGKILKKNNFYTRSFRRMGSPSKGYEIDFL